MRKGSVAVLSAVLAVALAGCASPGGSSTDSSTSVTSSATPTAAPSKLVVTVPSLAETSSALGPSLSAWETPSEASSAAGASSEPSTPAAPTTGAAPEAPATVDVTLANCDGCTVIATASSVSDGLSAALIGQNGRALLLSLDASGGVLGASNVPYGSTFPSPADGRLACGADGRCVVVAAADGHAVLSAFQMNGDGSWTDLSGSGGFVSATSDGLAVPLEGGYAAAIKVGDDSTTVWTVLAWTGSGFGVVGCTPDAAAPDLAALDLDACLS